MKLAEFKASLLMHFDVIKLKDGIKRYVLLNLRALRVLRGVLLLSGCVAGKPAACDRFFEAATPPGGEKPTDTLTAARNIARYPSHNAQRLFELLDDFYPVPAGKRYRDVPFVPYLFYAPSAWTLSLAYSGAAHTMVVFFGVAKPVRTPLIGPVRAW